MPVPTPQELKAALDRGEKKEAIWKRFGCTRAAVWSKKADRSWQHPELVAILEAHSDATRPPPTTHIRLRTAAKEALEQIAKDTGRPLLDVIDDVVKVGQQHLGTSSATGATAEETPRRKPRRKS